MSGINRAYEFDHLDNAVGTQHFTVKQAYLSKDTVSLISNENSTCINMSYKDARGLARALDTISNDVELHVKSESEDR